MFFIRATKRNMIFGTGQKSFKKSVNESDFLLTFVL